MTTRNVKCPHCGKPALFTPENSFRPFCSERCKLIDLGAWAEEKYSIPVNPAPEQGSELDEASETSTPHPESDEVSGASTSGSGAADEQNPHLH